MNRHLTHLAALGLAAALLGGCASQPVPAAPAALTREAQAALTPDAVLQRLQEGNQRFTTGRQAPRDLKMQIKATGYGQYPMASIVSCIDSRSAPELVFDQGIGDVFGVRIAGNFVNEDMLGSLEFASKVAGAKLIVVLGHTSCGAIKGACDDVALGNLTGMLGKIKPAVQSVAYAGERSSKNEQFVEMVAEANVRRTVLDILNRSAVLREMADKGQLRVVGAMLDVKTGEVRFY
ncbi:carbonic anhydrase family protein [Ramlibacter albus]|uniref:Carbonic anhydrase n=1 Tax=Ramlibacter albus TaxID=2079448 RepID=A0A923S2J8_9BURK|nr:carbonic anhydrase family protein [Ramlibacter albus]MBC5765426.1 carbonic anhydrase [Ramlibacter albus]